jgi:hypothetical protein
MSALGKVYRSGNILPFWNSDNLKKINYVPHENPQSGFFLIDKNDLNRYRSIMVHLYRGLPDFLNHRSLEQEFDWLENKSFAISLMHPGDILPLHNDQYSYFKKNNSLDDSFRIIRCIVFLENRKSGHFLDIDSNNIGSWCAGDWVAWKGETAHLAANLGIEDRYTLQITGIENVNLKDTASTENAGCLN